MKLPVSSSQAFVHDLWERDILPAMMDYIRIPNQSPAFDPEWESNGYMDEAVRLAHEWCIRHGPPDMRTKIVAVEHRTPLLLLEIPGSLPGTALLYGHLDKQPPLEESLWREGLGPRLPVREGDRLYGRGAVDNGYAVFTAIAALRLLREQGIAHPNCVVLIECSEESGSQDLTYYMEVLQDRLGTPELVICLDSSCGNYEQLWLTTSLRGMIGGVLTVSVLEAGVHSGDIGGVVPSSFRIARSLLERIETQKNGQIHPVFQVEIPTHRIRESEVAAEVLGGNPFARFPLVPGMRFAVEGVSAGIIERTWKPTLEITGADGLPGTAAAGNVLRPHTALRLSIRIPPTLDAKVASRNVQEILESDPPYGAHVSYREDWQVDGWQTPQHTPWLEAALQDASEAFFGKPALGHGEGFSIPFMSTLATAFPEAQFIVTGVMGPQANAHGPDEFLHIEMAKRLTLCIGEILARW